MARVSPGRLKVLDALISMNLIQLGPSCDGCKLVIAHIHGTLGGSGVRGMSHSAREQFESLLSFRIEADQFAGHKTIIADGSADRSRRLIPVPKSQKRRV